MKRLTALLIVLTLVAGGAFALELTLGLKGGVGHFDAWGSDYSDRLDEQNLKRDFSFGGSIGAFGRFGLVRRWSLQPEILFTSGGQKYSGSSGSGDDWVRVVRRTIEVPILVRRQFNLGPLTLAAFAGPNAQFKVGDFKLAQEGVDDTEIPDQKPMAFGADVGVGMDFQILRGVLTTDLRYSLGLTSWDDTGDDNTKPQSVRLFVGYGVAFL